MVDLPYVFFQPEELDDIPEGHGAIFGKTGSGKTSMLHKIGKRIAEKDSTLVILDPHGDLARSINIPGKTIFISPLFREINNKKYAIKMNLMEMGEIRDEIAINSVTETLKLLFSMDFDYSQGTWGPRLETVFSTAIPEVIRNVDNATLIDLIDSLMTKKYIEDKGIFSKLNGKFYYDYIQSTLNKIIPVVENPFLREFLCSRNVSFSFFRNDISGKVLSFYLA